MSPQSTSVPLTSLALTAVVLAALTCLLLMGRRWHVRWLRRRQWSRAQKAEAHAFVLLERLGYQVLGAQVEETYCLVVDGQSIPISVRADYIVSRDGRQFVAEVKSGRAAPLLATRSTRRQLLEYLVAFQVDGVLLVDGETRRVHEVVFPFPTRTALVPRARLRWMAVGLAAAAALAWMLRVW